VSINFADAVKPIGACAAEQTVRRAPDAGRNVLTDVVASGPAMFETARLDRAGGLDDTNPGAIAELKRRAAEPKATLRCLQPSSSPSSPSSVLGVSLDPKRPNPRVAGLDSGRMRTNTRL
jgi:hypothetical protein